jgi:hypothetical protein
MPYGDLICITLGLSEVITSPSGSPIVQPSDESQWGDLLAPGSYSSLDELAVFDTCFFEVRSGWISQVTNIGGTVAIKGSE